MREAECEGRRMEKGRRIGKKVNWKEGEWEGRIIGRNVIGKGGEWEGCPPSCSVQFPLTFNCKLPLQSFATSNPGNCRVLPTVPRLFFHTRLLNNITHNTLSLILTHHLTLSSAPPYSYCVRDSYESKVHGPIICEMHWCCRMYRTCIICTQTTFD